MIIKKKRKTENTPEKEQIQQQQEVVETNSDEEILSQFSIDNIKFEQRAERRQGSRRRGYRRIDDRNLISRAQEEAISIKEIAAKEGHKLGIEAAKVDIQRLQTSINEFFTYKDEVYNQISSGILDISVEIAKKIINKELETDNEALISIIVNALSVNAKNENRITIKVMPEDVDSVKDNIPEILSNAQFEAKIIVVPDNKITMGGAILETNNGVVDATIETQLEIIKEAFKKI